MKSNQFPFILLTVAFFCLFLLPNLGQEGLFVDGVTYGVIARNLAFVKGSFWTPFYTTFLYPNFFEHPPLALSMEAIFFKIIGDYHWIERLYSLFCAAVAALGIAKVWQVALPRYKKWYWLPLLFWLSMPIVPWSFSNNMLENTAVVFSIFSVFFMLKAVNTEKLGMQWILLSALFLVFTFLSKGIAMIFPLIGFSCYAIAKFQFPKKIILAQCLLITFWIIFMASLLLFIPEAKTNLLSYLTKQLNASQTVVTTSSRWFIVGKLLLELLPLLLLSSLVVGWQFFKQKINFSEYQEPLQMSIFWMLIGLSGVLPIVISTKQSGYYIMPAAMFFALAFAAVLVPLIADRLLKILNKNWFRISLIAMSALIISLSIFLMSHRWNTYRRDENLITDIKKIGQAIELDEITIQQDYDIKWLLIAYFIRYEGISLDETNQLEYYVGKKGNTPPALYKVVEMDLKELELYKKRK